MASIVEKNISHAGELSKNENSEMIYEFAVDAKPIGGLLYGRSRENSSISGYFSFLSLFSREGRKKRKW